MQLIFKKLAIILFLFLANSNLNAEIPYYLDFKFILNESDAGKKAQTELKNKLDKGIKSIREKEKNLQKEERKIIKQKKLLKPDEYKVKVDKLRSQVSSLQKERNNLLESTSKQRNKARNELLKNLNPIIKSYMQEKKIRMVIDKKSLLLADDNLNITKDIMDRLNKQLKSIKLN
jgi:Skp family chaperone for outer membrane proteins|tara:strand:+ start:1585 stop:2109 length:525 start_codon:yes stop_codon:yes gene_type:complete